jgi:hypothetical protein
VLEFDAPVVALVREGGGDDALLDLIVGVGGVAGPQPDALDAGGVRDVTL